MEGLEHPASQPCTCRSVEGAAPTLRDAWLETEAQEIRYGSSCQAAARQLRWPIKQLPLAVLLPVAAARPVSVVNIVLLYCSILDRCTAGRSTWQSRCPA